MDLYDEDLSENKFFRSLADKFPNLFDVATCNRCTICVPCVGSLLGFKFSKENIDSHVLVPVEEKPCCFVTVNGKELTIQSNVVTRGNGFTLTDPIPVLFEETFFNANDESYMVLCIAQPLDGATAVGDSQSKDSVLNSFTDYTTFLWGETGGEKNKKLVDQAIGSFIGRLHHLERESLTKHIDATSDLFTKAMQIVLKNRHLKKPAFQDSALMENVKIAVEAYVLHCVYKPLFAGICSCLAAHDEQLNKITRNLHELQLRDVGVRLEFCRNIPRARKELGYLMSYSTPLGKLNCLKRAVRSLMQPVQRANQTGNPLALTTDDLLPMLIFLVVKMEMPNWWANLTYMTSFHFAKSSNHDEYGFYLACLEAALEHVGAGQMEALMDGVETAQACFFSQ
ncbi:hypothetical protein NP493_697g01034 [Ridgeia piscesae]|uniref:VPS9 domain-containing protein n=1 Tax=Ridgeia piscesae TaxID=27915 RepID=A0AAD9NQM5_RIDPI|nr:hypothetical protein NP493_697g01034 [Ridgeia piscesae]